MTPLEWLLVLIAAMIVLAFFERIVFVLFATTLLICKLIDMILGSIFRKRRT